MQKTSAIDLPKYTTKQQTAMKRLVKAVTGKPMKTFDIVKVYRKYQKINRYDVFGNFIPDEKFSGYYISFTYLNKNDIPTSDEIEISTQQYNNIWR